MQDRMRSTRVAGLCVVGSGVLVSLWLGFAGEVQAADIVYANNMKTASGVERTSSSFSSLVGGSSNVNVGVGQHGVVTYRPAPGYVEIGRVESTGGNQTFLSHVRAQNVRSKCSWWISVGGEAELTCSART